MTDFNRVRDYYRSFDEWNRLESPEGKLEFVRTMEVLGRHLKPGSRILDLGGGPGRYTISLAREGHRVWLADLSSELLDIARVRIQESGVQEQVAALDEVNATDLSRYSDGMFDVVLALGPFYHLIEETQRSQAAREINRVLRDDGLLFAAFMPRLTGIMGLIHRGAERPDQVDAATFTEASQTGVFRNRTDEGFQEGYYPDIDEIVSLFESAEITHLNTVSIRGMTYPLADALWKIEAQSPDLFNEIMRTLQATESNPGVIDLGGHALYIGVKHSNGRQ